MNALISLRAMLLLLASTIDPATVTAAATPWQPAPSTPWQIVLGGKIDPSSLYIATVPVVDGDLFANTDNGADPKTVFGALHARGKKIVCYFSAGTYEPYRPDSAQYDKRDLGAALPEWPDERWVDIRSERVRAIIMARIELAAKMGCDAIDPDNMDGYVSSCSSSRRVSIIFFQRARLGRGSENKSTRENANTCTTKRPTRTEAASPLPSPNRTRST